jgi:glucose/arabinose dehydrogenase
MRRMMLKLTRTFPALGILSTAAVLAVAGVSSAAPPAASSAPRALATPKIRLAAIPGAAFHGPSWIGGGPDGRLYVAEVPGTLWRIVGRRHVRVLDLTSIVRQGTGGEFDEDGLLSVAFARDFRTSGHLFVYYTREPDGAGVVRRYTMRRGSIVANSARTILVVPLAPPAPAEAGGTLWTTADGMLWLAAGDGGTQGTRAYAQDMHRLQGKILRVRPGRNGGHTIPADNPFVHRAGARGEIWALGLRQPWRVNLDAPTGDRWVTDVGQSQREEIDVLRAGSGAGANFGWPRLEGNRTIHRGFALTRGTRYVRPFVTWDHSSADECHAVMGGGVYRGPVAALRGWYVYANLCGTKITALDPGTRRKVTLPGVPGIDAFGTLANGSMYAASVFDGRIYRIVGA